MKFNYVEPNENFPLAHLLSEGKRWECGFVKMLFGVRFRIGRAKMSWCEVDLCCGADAILRCLVMEYCLEKMEDLDEKKVTPNILNELFPYPKIRPLNNDPEWCKRLNLAGASPNIKLKEFHYV